MTGALLSIALLSYLKVKHLTDAPFYLYCFQKHGAYQPFSVFVEAKPENSAVEYNAQTDENCDEEVSRIWDVKFGNTDDLSTVDDNNKISSTFVESPVCSSFMSDLSCDSLTQGSIPEVITDTKDPSGMLLHCDSMFPKSDSVNRSWQSTMVCTSQQQIIDCVVDQICFPDSKVQSDWIKNELPYPLKPMNNNDYESTDETKVTSECCNPSGKANPAVNTIYSSQNQNISELQANQSDNTSDISTEDISHLLSDKSEFILVNDADDSQCIGIISQAQEESNVERNNNIPETALLLEVKSEPLKDDEEVPQLKEESYEIQILNDEEISSEARLDYSNLELMETVDSQTEEGNLVFILKSDSTEPDDTYEMNSEILSPSFDKRSSSGSKPARACKGVRYREFMSNSQLGKRRARKKQRLVRAPFP